MRFGLSGEQRMLQDAVASFLAETCPLEVVRKAAAGNADPIVSVEHGLTELGAWGVMTPSEFGGLGLGLLEAALIGEAMAYRTAPVRFLGSRVMAPLALSLGGSPSQQNAWLPRITAGEASVAVAMSATGDERDGAGIRAQGGRLTGTQLAVLDAASPDLVLVGDHSGRLHLVPPDAPGVELMALPTIDRTRTVGKLRLSNVAAEPLAGATPAVTQRVIDAGRVMLAADILGAASSMIDQAVAYAGQREQFGRPIASFQAVKHMCAEMAAQLEPCRALVWYAAHAFDHVPEDAALTACHAKSHLSEVGQFVARTATEVHGGYGFTDLAGLHFWFKRIGLDRQLLGGPTAIREEAARLQGWLTAPDERRLTANPVAAEI